jgi:undecaprenyl-diphosphatase
VSLIVAYATIAWLLHLVAHHRITIFNPYRITLGVALIAALSTGLISAT